MRHLHGSDGDLFNVVLAVLVTTGLFEKILFLLQRFKLVPGKKRASKQSWGYCKRTRRRLSPLQVPVCSVTELSTGGGAESLGSAPLTDLTKQLRDISVFIAVTKNIL